MTFVGARQGREEFNMRSALLCAFGLVMIACGGGGGASQPSTTARPIRGPADLISEGEINAGVYQNALEIVQSLRPAMLRPRGTSSGGGPVVLYVDNVKMTDVSGGLATVPSSRVREIRFINANDATTRWGTGHASGVILLTTKR
jgi:hypothetical protein